MVADGKSGENVAAGYYPCVIHAGNKTKSMITKDKMGGKICSWQQVVENGKNRKNVVAG